MHNIYNQVQVKLLMRPDELHDVPPFDEVFSEDEVRLSPAASSFRSSENFLYEHTLVQRPVLWTSKNAVGLAKYE